MIEYESICQKLEEKQILYRTQESLDKHTTFNIGGPCDLFVTPENEEEFGWLLLLLKEEKIPFFILGRGSNLLVSDDGFRGVILSTEKLQQIFLLDETHIFCSGGVSLFGLCKFALKHSLSGLEFAYGIPGSVGGAIYMNAGAYGGEMKDVVSQVNAIDFEGNNQSYTNREAEFAYRNSRFHAENQLITSGVFELQSGDPVAIKELMEEYYCRRKEKQPVEYPSAGSTFKRPDGAYAAALIEECGWKGVSVGGAQVSEKHSGFVINRNKATCKDVKELIGKIQKDVLEKTGFSLECEVKQLG